MADILLQDDEERRKALEKAREAAHGQPGGARLAGAQAKGRPEAARKALGAAVGTTGKRKDLADKAFCPVPL